MSKSEDKLIQYLNEAHATELALVSTLRAHISMTPTGSRCRCSHRMSNRSFRPWP